MLEKSCGAPPLDQRQRRLVQDYQATLERLEANFRKEPGVGACVWIGGVMAVVSVGFLGYDKNYGPNKFLAGACFMVVLICAVRGLSLWSERKMINRGLVKIQEELIANGLTTTMDITGRRGNKS